MNEAFRQSGRTTRLLEQACKAAWAGRAVYVFAHNSRDVGRLQNEIEKIWSGMRASRNHGIKIEDMQYWHQHQRWDWERMQPIYGGSHPNCLWLVDHAAVERRIDSIQDQIKYLAELAGKLYPHTV